MAFRTIASACALALAALPAAAQTTLTAEEILLQLQAQRDALSSGGQGATRTLEFVDESTPQSASGASVATTVDGDMIGASLDGDPLILSEKLVLDLTIFFEFDSALLKAETIGQVQALCTAIQSDEGDSTYQIIGHTDASGSVQYNLNLSRARAESVVRYLVDECGIDAGRLEAVGMGPTRLKDTDDPRADVNRRVEIQVML